MSAESGINVQIQKCNFKSYKNYTLNIIYYYYIGTNFAHSVTKSKPVNIIRKQHSFNKRFKLLTTHINQHLTNAKRVSKH